MVPLSSVLVMLPCFTLEFHLLCLCLKHTWKSWKGSKKAQMTVIHNLTDMLNEHQDVWSHTYTHNKQQLMMLTQSVSLTKNFCKNLTRIVSGLTLIPRSPHCRSIHNLYLVSIWFLLHRPWKTTLPSTPYTHTHAYTHTHTTAGNIKYPTPNVSLNLPRHRKSPETPANTHA